MSASLPIPQAESTEVASEVSPHQKLLSHVKQYPIVTTGADAVFMVPHSKQVYDLVKPKAKIIRETQPVKMVLDKCDTITDGLLTQVDTLFPLIKTLEVHDITDPVVRPALKTSEEVKIAYEMAHEKAMRTVVEPTVKSLNGIRYNVHSVMYDENGKSVVTSKLDPIVAPVNEKLEGVISSMIPDIKKVSKDQSSELERTALILINVITQAREDPQPEPTEAPTTTVEA